MIDEAKCLGSIEVRRVEASVLSPDNVNHQSQTLEVQINLFPYQSNAERTRDKEDVFRNFYYSRKQPQKRIFGAETYFTNP